MPESPQSADTSHRDSVLRSKAMAYNLELYFKKMLLLLALSYLEKKN